MEGKGPKKPADPSRFEFFNLLPDDTGFKILGSNHVYLFDEFGGWEDEYGNYYDKDVKPCTNPNKKPSGPPHAEERKYAEEKAKRVSGADESRKLDEYYKGSEEVYLEISNLKYSCTEDEMKTFLTSKAITQKAVDFDYDNRNKFTGYCCVTLNHDNAKKLIALDGQDFLGRRLEVRVMDPEEYDDYENDDDEDEDDHGYESHDDGDDFEDFYGIYINNENRRQLHDFHGDEQINVEIRNLDVGVTEENLNKFLETNGVAWLKPVDFEYDDKNEKTGYAYLTLDKANTEKLALLNGKDCLGRELQVRVIPKEEHEGEEEDEEGKNEKTAVPEGETEKTEAK